MISSTNRSGIRFFRRFGILSVLSGDNQVLRRREGYRQIAAAAAIVEGSLGLEWILRTLSRVAEEHRHVVRVLDFVRLAQAVASMWGPWVEGGSLRRVGERDVFGIAPAGPRDCVSRHRRGLDDRRRTSGSTRTSVSPHWTTPMRPDASLASRSLHPRRYGCTSMPNTRSTGTSRSRPGQADEEEAGGTSRTKQAKGYPEDACVSRRNPRVGSRFCSVPREHGQVLLL